MEEDNAAIIDVLNGLVAKVCEVLSQDEQHKNPSSFSIPTRLEDCRPKEEFPFECLSSPGDGLKLPKRYFVSNETLCERAQKDVHFASPIAQYNVYADWDNSDSVETIDLTEEITSSGLVNESLETESIVVQNLPLRPKLKRVSELSKRLSGYEEMFQLSPLSYIEALQDPTETQTHTTSLTTLTESCLPFNRIQPIAESYMSPTSSFKNLDVEYTDDVQPCLACDDASLTNSCLPQKIQVIVESDGNNSSDIEKPGSLRAESVQSLLSPDTNVTKFCLPQNQATAESNGNNSSNIEKPGDLCAESVQSHLSPDTTITSSCLPQNQATAESDGRNSSSSQKTDKICTENVKSDASLTDSCLPKEIHAGVESNRNHSSIIVKPGNLCAESVQSYLRPDTTLTSSCLTQNQGTDESDGNSSSSFEKTDKECTENVNSSSSDASLTDSCLPKEINPGDESSSVEKTDNLCAESVTCHLSHYTEVTNAQKIQLTVKSIGDNCSDMETHDKECAESIQSDLNPDIASTNFCMPQKIQFAVESGGNNCTSMETPEKECAESLQSISPGASLTNPCLHEKIHSSVDSNGTHSSSVTKSNNECVERVQSHLCTSDTGLYLPDKIQPSDESDGNNACSIDKESVQSTSSNAHLTNPCLPEKILSCVESDGNHSSSVGKPDHECLESGQSHACASDTALTGFYLPDKIKPTDESDWSDSSNIVKPKEQFCKVVSNTNHGSLMSSLLNSSAVEEGVIEVNKPSYGVHTEHCEAIKEVPVINAYASESCTSTLLNSEEARESIMGDDHKKDVENLALNEQENNPFEAHSKSDENLPPMSCSSEGDVTTETNSAHSEATLIQVEGKCSIGNPTFGFDSESSEASKNVYGGDSYEEMNLSICPKKSSHENDIVTSEIQGSVQLQINSISDSDCQINEMSAEEASVIHAPILPDLPGDTYEDAEILQQVMSKKGHIANTDERAVPDIIIIPASPIKNSDSQSSLKMKLNKNFINDSPVSNNNDNNTMTTSTVTVNDVTTCLLPSNSLDLDIQDAELMKTVQQKQEIRDVFEECEQKKQDGIVQVNNMCEDVSLSEGKSQISSCVPTALQYQAIKDTNYDCSLSEQSLVTALLIDPSLESQPDTQSHLLDSYGTLRQHRPEDHPKCEVRNGNTLYNPSQEGRDSKGTKAIVENQGNIAANIDIPNREASSPCFSYYLQESAFIQKKPALFIREIDRTVIQKAEDDLSCIAKKQNKQTESNTLIGEILKISPQETDTIHLHSNTEQEHRFITSEMCQPSCGLQKATNEAITIPDLEEQFTKYVLVRSQENSSTEFITASQLLESQNSQQDTQGPDNLSTNICKQIDDNSASRLEIAKKGTADIAQDGHDLIASKSSQSDSQRKLESEKDIKVTLNDLSQDKHAQILNNMPSTKSCQSDSQYKIESVESNSVKCKGLPQNVHLQLLNNMPSGTDTSLVSLKRKGCHLEGSPPIKKKQVCVNSCQFVPDVDTDENQGQKELYFSSEGPKFYSCDVDVCDQSGKMYCKSVQEYYCSQEKSDEKEDNVGSTDDEEGHKSASSDHNVPVSTSLFNWQRTVNVYDQDYSPKLRYGEARAGLHETPTRVQYTRPPPCKRPRRVGLSRSAPVRSLHAAFRRTPEN